MAKKYKISSQLPQNTLNEPMVTYAALTPSNPFTNFVQGVLQILGMGAQTAHPPIQNNADFIPIIREGVPRKSIDHLMENTGLTVSDISSIIRTSDRTLRRYNAKHKLNPEQSERLIELAKLYSRGKDVFGSMDRFKQWIGSNVVALGNKKPIEFLDTSIGISLLLNELGRIEHGIFA